MGRDSIQPAQQADVSPPIDPSFVPMCPECRYDLSGLPDSACPECGKPFTFAALYADAQQSSLHRARSPHLLLLLCAFFVFPCSPVSFHPSMLDDGILFAWMLCTWLAFGWWAVRARGLIFGSRSRLQLLLLYPMALGVCVFLASNPSDPSYSAWIVSVLGTLLVSAAWWSIRPRRLWAPTLWLAVHLLTFGLMLVVFSLAPLTFGTARPTLVDPRIGQVYRQYGLSGDEAFAFGISPVLAGGVLLLIALLLLMRNAERR